MAYGVHLGILLLCLIHAASVSGLLKARAYLFQRHDSDAESGPKGPAQPQNQLRQALVQSFGAHGQGQSGGGYVHASSPPAQKGRPSNAVEQSRPQPRSSWQAVRYPPTKTSQKPADSRRAPHPLEAQTRRQRPSPPPKSSTLFIDGVYVQMQTSARGRGRKVSGGSYSTPSLFSSSQGRWLQGRYKSVPEDSQSSPGDHVSGKPKSKFFTSTNAILAPSGRDGAHNLPPSRKRPSGNPDVHYAPTEVHEIPEHLGGSAIRRLKPQRPALSQKRVYPRMHHGTLPGSSLRKDGGRGM